VAKIEPLNRCSNLKRVVIEIGVDIYRRQAFREEAYIGTTNANK